MKIKSKLTPKIKIELKEKVIGALEEIKQNQLKLLSELNLKLTNASKFTNQVTNRYVKEQPLLFDLFSRPLVYDHSSALLMDSAELEELFHYLQEDIEKIEKAEYRFLNSDQKDFLNKTHQYLEALFNLATFLRDWSIDIMNAKRDQFDKTGLEAYGFRAPLIKHIPNMVKFHKLRDQYQVLEKQLEISLK